MAGIGEAFLSASVQFLFDKVVDELGKLYGVKDELAKLERTLARLRAMLLDAEQKKMEGERFTLWLQQLKNAARDAEDVVDAFDYEELRRKVQRSSESGSGDKKSWLSTLRKVCKLFSCLSPHETSFRHQMAHKIDDIHRKLEEISKDNKDLDIGGMSNVGMSRPEYKGHTKETSSLLVDPIVFGRVQEREELIRLLLRTSEGGSSSPSSSIIHPTDLPVVSIVGMGGLGKTTLAQCVYNSKEVQQHFHLRTWVHVSPDFDLKSVTKQILEHFIGEAQPGFQSIDNLNVLQQRLVEKLGGKRFLVVLDDVWEEDYGKWENFCAPLTQGGKGSKVLITTRNAKVADMVRSVRIQLPVLSPDDCWSIFKTHAFPNGDSSKYPELESTGKQIVGKLRGIPLAMKTIGGALRFQLDERKWSNVLENELWELEKGREDILPVLKLSYEYLPSHLKQCFAYCCIFPKGSGFEVLELVQFWMAQGYISPQGKKPAEEIGRDCFNELLSMSLLQSVNGRYVIHDLLHDLGRLILQHDSCEINLFQSQEIPQDAECRSHLILYCQKTVMRGLEVLYKFNRLCTFMLIDFSWWWYFREVFQAPVDFLGAMKCLRVLDLRYCGIENLPESIENLIHLRYLNLSGTPIDSLPESLCALYKLQTLRLNECYKLYALPKGMSNLVSLHYLETRQELVSNILGIGKLIHLQYLEAFWVSEENSKKIGELKDMNELRGKLCIRNLHRVGTKEDALKAKLKNKLYLEILELEWADGRDIAQIDKKVEESIIEGLEPHPRLKVLIVKCYAGVNVPTWISSISSLESLYLCKCINLNPLPPFSQPYFLKTLYIVDCPYIEELPQLPTTLMNLMLGGVEQLRALPDNLHELPLEHLAIWQIPGLKALPLLPTTLKELTVADVGLEALPEICQPHELPAATSTAGNKYKSGDNRERALFLLKIQGCPHLTTLHGGLLNHHLRHLGVLSIMNCQELAQWPEGEGFQATLRSLEGELSVEMCPKLKALPDGSTLSPSLKRLFVMSSPGVPSISLFSQLHNLNSGDVLLEMEYPSLACCSNKALSHIMLIDSLHIDYVQQSQALEGSTAAERKEEEEESSPAASVSLVYTTELNLNEDSSEYYLAREVSLDIRGRRRGRRPLGAAATVALDDEEGVTAGDGSSELVCMFLEGHAWMSNLRTLRLNNIPADEASFDAPCMGQGQTLRLPSLRYVRIWGCREMTRLPTGTLLRHLTALKKFTIRDCPELTLSSVVEGIRSIPSLKILSIYTCPKLLMPPPPPPSPLLKNEGGSEDAAPSAPPSPLLQRLHIDNAGLLALLQVDIDDGLYNSASRSAGLLFRDHLVTSLRCLRITESSLTGLTAAEEMGLRTLASCIQGLELTRCPNLQNLPADMGAILPDLRVLCIRRCPGIRCLPVGGLPPSLELLTIRKCPLLERRCLLPIQGAAEEDGDWHKFARVPVVEINRDIVRGTYYKFLELKAKWDSTLEIFSGLQDSLVYG